jgi:hypothetical protein
MANKKTTDPRAKKIELQAELKRIEKEIDTSLGEVKNAAADSFGLSSLVRKYPLQAVAASLFLGLLAGQKGNRSGKSRQRIQRPESTGRVNSVRNLLAQEIKRLLVKRGVSLLSEKLDEQFSSKPEKQDSESSAG